MDPLIEGYLSYLDKVGRKTPRTVIDVRCTLRRAIAGLDRRRPGVDLWRLSSRIICTGSRHERQHGRTAASLAKYLSHVRGLPRLRLAQRSHRAQRARWIQSAAHVASRPRPSS